MKLTHQRQPAIFGPSYSIVSAHSSGPLPIEPHGSKRPTKWRVKALACSTVAIQHNNTLVLLYKYKFLITVNHVQCSTYWIDTAKIFSARPEALGEPDTSAVVVVVFDIPLVGILVSDRLV